MDRRVLAAFGAAVALASAAGSACAQDSPIDLTVCRSGSIQFLEQSKNAAVLAIDIAGVIVSASDKRFESMTSRCLGVGSNVNGKRTGNGFCKFLDVDGDTNVLAYTVSPEKPGEGTWQYVHGTGKWAGITGGGDWTTVTRGKPFAAGTFQSCNHAKGKFKVAK